MLVSLSLTTFLIIATIRVNRTLKSFFRMSYGKQACAVMSVTIIVAIAVFMELTLDVVSCIVLRGGSVMHYTDAGQPPVIGGLVLLIPCIVVNTLHFLNWYKLRSSKRDDIAITQSSAD